MEYRLPVKMFPHPILIVVLIGLCGRWPVAANDTSSVPEGTFSAESIEFFEKEVRPVLANRCFECHNSKMSAPKGGLKLDSRAASLAGGDTGPAVVPGDLKKSLLVDAINYGELYQMPPKTRLPANEVAVLTKWVSLGAPWPKEDPSNQGKAMAFDLQERLKEHWAWKPIFQHGVKTVAPQVNATSWAKQPSDLFILRKLEENALTPNDAADRATLLRRASFDVVGLPPRPEQIDAFAADSRPDAWERVVDQLLANPHLGERSAREWMDLVRYAETCGHEFDYPIRNAYYYRDYLIRAFNNDLPYDQLAVEHIAGDLLPNGRVHPENGINESALGTTFWFLGEVLHAPVDVKGDFANRIDNQLDVFSKTFLGMTVACSRCHDHKFDAISQKDYYSLAGFLTSSRRQEMLLDPHHEIHDGAIKVDSIRQEGDAAFAKAINDAVPNTSASFAAYLRGVVDVFQKAQSTPPTDALIETVAKERSLSVSRLKKFVRMAQNDGTLQTSNPMFAYVSAARGGGDAEKAIAQTRAKVAEAATRQQEIDQKYPLFASFSDSTWRDWFVTGEAFGSGPTTARRWNFLSERLQAIRPGVAHSGYRSRKLQGVLRSPTFTIEHPNIYYRLTGEAAEVRLIVDGYTMIEFHQLLFGGLKFDVNTKGEYGWHRQAGDLNKYLGHRAYIEFVDHGDGYVGVDEIRFSHETSAPSRLSAILQDVLASSHNSVEQLVEAYANRWAKTLERWRQKSASLEEVEWINWSLEEGLIDPTENGKAFSETLAAIHERAEKVAASLPAPIHVPGMADGTGENERIYVRGNHRLTGDIAPRQMIEALTGGAPYAIHGSGRLELAHTVVSPDNPLTARVAVNRVWQKLLGRGIVATVDNFGVLGERPTHPELLDWLAADLMENDWSIKKMYRETLLSSTFQMSSSIRAEASEKDPTNQLWHRAPIRRLEGEFIRDAMLVLSNRFDERMYGPSVPVHITPFMQGRGRPGSSGPLDGNGRRTIYTEIRRNFLSPMMLAFDSPIPFSTVGRRNESNVPAQALILLNDPFVLEQAKSWAKTVRGTSSDVDGAIERMYRFAFSRAPTAAEREESKRFLSTQASEYGITPEQALNDERVWTDLCHVLLNVKEFIYVN